MQNWCQLYSISFIIFCSNISQDRRRGKWSPNRKSWHWPAISIIFCSRYLAEHWCGLFRLTLFHTCSRPMVFMIWYQKRRLRSCSSYMFNFNVNQMKKRILNVLAMLLIAVTLSSCATVFGGTVSSCQRTKPAPGAAARPIRAVALIADIVLFWPGTIVDFATGAIYKPCNK